MEQILVTVTNVLVLSSVYIMVALGFAFLFNMLGILNLAHGAIYMVGGYLGFKLITLLGLNPWAALLITTIIVAGFGVFLEKFCFRPFIGDFNRDVMVCVVITVILQTSVNIIAGAEIVSLPSFAEGFFKTQYFSISYERLLIVAIGISLLGIMTWFVKVTKWGQQMQAIAQDMEGAALQGINIHKISAIACALGCGVAAIAGCLIGAYLWLSPFMGDAMLVKILILVILSGIGSFGGIFITGLALGCLDSLLPMITNGSISDAIAASIVVILLLIRPRGFFGHEA